MLPTLNKQDVETKSNTAMVSMLWKIICSNNVTTAFLLLLVLNKKRYESTILLKREVVAVDHVNEVELDMRDAYRYLNVSLWND